MRRPPLEAEIAAVIESDLRMELGMQDLTPAKLKAAMIESVCSLQPPIRVRVDPDDPNRLLIGKF